MYFSKKCLLAKIYYLENVFLNMVKMNIFENYYMSHYDDL